MMNGWEITHALRVKGSGVTKIAKALAVSPAAVSQVIHGSRGNPRIRRVIAEVLGKRVCDIWDADRG